MTAAENAQQPPAGAGEGLPVREGPPEARHRSAHPAGQIPRIPDLRLIGPVRRPEEIQAVIADRGRIIGSLRSQALF